jgi:BirA family biotin operon repressor/biotin-[acetyl-CoA-carboxylase] ligase
VDPLIWRIEHFVEVDSTNTWLAREARGGAPEGLVAYADFQSAGRGRLDRQWEAPPRSALLCSVLLRPQIDADQLQLVVACVSLATRAALVRLCGVRPGLKWPNDLVVDDAKLAGLLAQVVDTESPAVVVGLGLNLTSSPQHVRSTNVLAAAGVTISSLALLDILLEELEWRRAQLDSEEGRTALHDEYQRALVTLGQRVRVQRPNDILVGEALRVDQSGRLVVDVGGDEMTFATGDVVHVHRHSDEWL